MGETKWTKGEWERGIEDDAPRIYCQGLLVATAHGRLDLPAFEPSSEKEYDECIEEIEANTDLISAAPDMYEALETVEALLGLTISRQYPELAVMVNDAMAKARGETDGSI